jgi:hypothetical protein
MRRGNARVRERPLARRRVDAKLPHEHAIQLGIALNSHLVLAIKRPLGWLDPQTPPSRQVADVLLR